MDSIIEPDDIIKSIVSISKKKNTTGRLNMKYLVIYAHPNPESFNSAILKTVTEELIKGNCDFELRDLYASSFDPVLNLEDLKDLGRGTAAKDIKEEQKLVLSTDYFIVIHPVWWFSMPSILKGYLDRIFSTGFAFQPSEEGVKGLLEGKRIISFNTTGASKKAYEEYGYRDCFRKNICEGIYRFCGLEVTGQHFLYSVAQVSDGERKEMLEGVKNIMKSEVMGN